MKTLSTYKADIPRIINNSLTDNVNWGVEMINDAIRYLVSKFYLNERSYTTTTVAQQQFYPLPPQVKELINVTITIGSVVWQPKECPSRQFWDNLNVITFYQDFPSYFFVYNGQVGIYPIPASANSMTLNYKTRIPDLSMDDVTDTSSGKTVALTNGTTTFTISGTGALLNWMPGNYIRSPYSSTNATSGDNQWYQIASVSSGTTGFLMAPYTGNTITGAPFTIGQVSILPEDYQDLPLYRMGSLYYTTRAPDPAKSAIYTEMYTTGENKLNEEFGSKTSSVILNDTDSPVVNPNLFQRQVS